MAVAVPVPAAAAPGNSFAPLKFERMHKDVVRSRDGLSLTGAPIDQYQMAVGDKGMVVRAGEGLAYFQVRVVRTAHGVGVILGLVGEEASVQGNQYPGRSAGSVGWRCSGGVFWNLSGNTPERLRFAAADLLVVVLDCRAQPCVRVLLNGTQRICHPLASQATRLFPAIAVRGYRSLTPEQQPCVEAAAVPAPPQLP